MPNMHPEATRRYMSDRERQDDMFQATPRQRVSMNRATPLVLTGAWQTVPFAEYGNPRDRNSFPTNRYDYANQLILANPETDYEQAYQLSMDFGVALNAANTYIKLALRFEVPAPTPMYFPLPDSLGRLDLPDQLVSPSGSVHADYTVYSAEPIRLYGARLQIRATGYRLNSGLLGNLVGVVTTILTGTDRPTLTDAAMNMFAL